MFYLRETFSVDVIDESIAAALRELIRGSGWTPYKVARVAKVPRQSVYRFLSGKRMLDLDTADRIVKALKAKCELRKREQA